MNHLLRLLALGAIIACSFTAVAGEEQGSKPVKVFILAGQSNCVGKGDGDKLPEEYRASDPDLLLFCNGYNWKGLAPLAPYPSEPNQAKMYGLGKTMFGPEIAFGHAMRKRYPGHRVVLIKSCVGGTSVVVWSKDLGSPESLELCQMMNFKPEILETTKKQVAEKKTLYHKLVGDVKEGLAGIQAPYEICAFLWIQAERDSGHARTAAAWPGRVVRLHKDLAAEIGYSPEIPLLVMGPHFHLLDTGESPHKAALIAGIRKVSQDAGTVTLGRLKEAAGLPSLSDDALTKELQKLRYWPPDCLTQMECVGIMNRGLQEQAATHLNLAIIRSDDLPTHEGLHFDTKGQIELGRRLAAALRE